MQPVHGHNCDPFIYDKNSKIIIIKYIIMNML